MTQGWLLNNQDSIIGKYPSFFSWLKSFYFGVTGQSKKRSEKKRGLRWKRTVRVLKSEYIETNEHSTWPESGWLEDDPFLWAVPPIFRGKRLVSLRVLCFTQFFFWIWLCTQMICLPGKVLPKWSEVFGGCWNISNSPEPNAFIFAKN